MKTKKAKAPATKAAEAPATKTRETLSERVVRRMIESGMAKADAEKVANIVAVRSRRAAVKTPLTLTDKGAVIPTDLLKSAFGNSGPGAPVAHLVNARKREPRIIILWAPKL